MENTLPPYSVHPTAFAETVDPWHTDDLGFDEEQAITLGDGITIGVADTGVSQSHVKSGDFTECFQAGRDFTGSGGYWDDNDHGSHVDGLIFAKKKPGRKFRGGAPHARMIVAKVLNKAGSGQSDWIADGIKYLADQGCHLINGSFGSPRSDDLILRAIEEYIKGGGVMVCAAGNDGGKLNYPGRSNWVVSCGAYDRFRSPAPFSCRGNELDAAAPGVEIVSCGAEGYMVMSGTSMASPLLTAQIALYQSYRLKNGLKLLDLNGVLAWIKRKATDAGDPGRDPVFGEGILSGKAIFDDHPPTSEPTGDEWQGDEWKAEWGTIHRPAKPGDSYSVKLGA